MSFFGKSFKSLTVFTVTISTLIVFLSIYVVLFAVIEKEIEKNFIVSSKSFSSQIFDSMYQIMRKGWKREDVLTFINTIEKNYKDTPIQINIFRGDLVKKLFGSIPEKEKDIYIKDVLKSGEVYTKNKNMILRAIYPITARKECLKCHINAKSGNILGAIEITKDERKFLTKLENTLFFAFVFLLPIPLFLSYIVGNFISQKINNISKDLTQKINEAKKLKDLKLLEITNDDEYYEEIKNLSNGIRFLINKIKEIAIDKDILEFEIKLTEKLIITSDMIKEWQEYIKYILLEVNNIANVYYIFTVFIDGNKLQIDVFWRTKPAKENKELLEKLLKTETIKENLLNTYNLEFITIDHHIANTENNDIKINNEDFITKTKSIFLEKPKIGGIVGIGIGSDIIKDNNRGLVADSILSTLINITGSVRAISKYIKEIEFYAMRDPLTYLYNQRVFWELLGYEIERAKRHNKQLSLIFMDLDNFKYINDTYGHSLGNLVLKEIARVINETKRKEDIPVRFGGDEFAIILTDASIEDAYILAERLRRKIESISIPSGKEIITTSVSIGISHFPENGETPRELFIVADKLASKAKNEGKNRIKIPSVEDVAEVFVKSSEKVLKIIDAVNKESITPHFQPILDIKNMSIFGYEALMRINQNDTSVGEFIEIAEDIGVIPRLDRIVIKKSIKQYHVEKCKLHLFVNISVRDIISSNIINTLNKLTKEYNVKREKIVVELTERESLKNISIIKEFTNSLKQEGYLFAIDDFGSGYSTFKYLKELPVDIVKIDGEFIKGMLNSEKDKIFVKSLIDLAKGMGLKVLAEFVENEKIFNMVKELNIDFAQGYYIGKPSPILKLYNGRSDRT